MAKDIYKWTDNPTVSGVSICDTDVLNECLMHLKYDKKDGGGFNLFDIKVSDHILLGEEAVGWLLQGSLVTMTYPDAVDKIKSEYENGADETDSFGITFRRSISGRKIADISQFDAIDEVYVTKGYGDYYILDSINSQFYLPKNKYAWEYTADTTKVNEFIEAGLPNITGYFGADDRVLNNLQGCFYGGAYGYGTGSQGAEAGYIVHFDASKSNELYGKSTTVQPPAILKLIYYKVGDTTTNESTIDVENVLAELALLNSQKADLNLSNVTKPHIVDTYRNQSSWYKIWSDGWIEQGGYIGAVSTGTLEFLYPFTTTDYTVLSGIKILSPNQPHSVYWNNFTFTSVDYSTRVQTGQAAGSGYTCSAWYAFGY